MPVLWREGEGDGELSVTCLGTDHGWAVSCLRDRNSLPRGGQERVHSLSLCEETGQAREAEFSTDNMASR